MFASAAWTRATSVGDGRPYFARYHCSDQLLPDCATAMLPAVIANTLANKIFFPKFFMMQLLPVVLTGYAVDLSRATEPRPPHLAIKLDGCSFRSRRGADVQMRSVRVQCERKRG
uniref:Uncharacterized protein n=1 Tax=mine drainage metagenome TaxID=410659 RepID=E6PXU4_9ZZZZ